MDIPRLIDIELSGKRVLVRADLDLPAARLPDWQGRQALSAEDDYRLQSLVPTLDYIKEKGGKIILLGHRGRPEGKVVEELSLKPFEKVLEKWNVEVLENLRFNPGEEANDGGFAKELAAKADIYINEAFGASHRKHASIVALPLQFKSKSKNSVAAGLRFVREVENLSKVFENPKRPVVIIISGIKDDKLKYIEDFLKIADKILIGGRLPDYIHDASALRYNSKVLVASLIADKEDITIHFAEISEKEIAGAGTIIVSGPLGKFEEGGHRQGTERVLKAVANSSAFRVAGGGDTVSAISLLALGGKFDWISVGGGAMLEFLAKGTLPGIQALVQV
ncbi:hypothetical protein A2125_02130 [Candidatus Woesebacteria bacterium GWB1_43_5]|uniref:Phosphoglycerate kinase n=1 Tax=Candidatus Woesebacteria bacterium GWB1_43_5 TaxID=1802474 RepID=A0A1F7WRH6_9BACT|nr:MAG: hypothetical protein A2125_02130 [Candidatus Woesebacteria bacterium GWB1_43_5]